MLDWYPGPVKSVQSLRKKWLGLVLSTYVDAE